jgi:hypothetical protein
LHLAGLPTQFCAAFSAGFFMACTVSPFDMVSERGDPDLVAVLPLQLLNACVLSSQFVSLLPFASFLQPQVRTRLMNQPSDARIYKGFFDCFVKVGAFLLPSLLCLGDEF